MEVASLVWADDIVLLASTETDLQRMLSTLEIYCETNRLTINSDKTKCMIFNKTGRLMRRHFIIKRTPIECVRSFKYLGFMITPSGEIHTGLQDLRDRALKAFMKLKYTMGDAFKQDISITLFLTDMLIKPILLYLSDFWGCLKLLRNNLI